jgi:uncharacterized protein YjbI with pentapeptide repeats
MADKAQLSRLTRQQGIPAWNRWRGKEESVRINLRDAVLPGANLVNANLSGADLGAADLCDADLSGADLSEARLIGADLDRAKLVGANLSKADLDMATLNNANLFRAVLTGANLAGATLRGANLRNAELGGASLLLATLVEANLSGADLSGCSIYGISAWGLKGINTTKQQNLVITPPKEPKITVDNIEVAQFVYLLLNNAKIRDVIDTITSKAVLILGRFAPERKVILDTLRTELRSRGRTPILFDFSGPRSKNTTDTVKLLAQMVRYIIVDLSDPNSAPYELGVISMLGLKTTPVVPIIMSNQKPFPMLEDVLQERWSTKLITYRDLNDLRALLDGKLVSIAEAKVLELRPYLAAT